ncbi:unnamed protein product [Callosobruchus maculatus]|uniref:Large ribosomal subunit protein bL17m n=1 Tax=Callosobruchus maculatus TaxID=64391 RepID=A0A653DFN9_CALMS|nr:unnamed protein product [Callosobruchus maculatus]
MNQAEVTKLVSQLRIKVNSRLRKFRNPKGPEERLNKLRKTVTALIKHERIELNYPRADEARMYAERLISDAIRYGDCHKTTMEMADYWLVEKQLIHKLFKVLAPRYENYTVAYTRMLPAPRSYPGYLKAVLELKGNPYPSLLPDTHTNRNLIHNVLLDEAKKAYRMQKYKEIANKVEDRVRAEAQAAGAQSSQPVDVKSNTENAEVSESSQKELNKEVEVKDK